MSKNKSKLKEETITFSIEEALKKLEKISKELEDDNLELERAIELYEQGMSLSKQCYERLKKAELKIQEIKKTFEDLTTE
jgi:exodeoxyribonuclease VII small subunit